MKVMFVSLNKNQLVFKIAFQFYLRFKKGGAWGSVVVKALRY
jgi:hypothetical protein